MSEPFTLVAYLNRAMKNIISGALKASLKNPKESAFILKYIQEAKRAEKVRMQYEDNDLHIPPFLIASITTSCNLFCKGCYARANHACHEEGTQNQLSCDNWESIFAQANELGISFILLAGGEPLMRKDVIDCASHHKSIIFPVFTNGTMVTAEYLKLFDKNRNLVPILSIEGNEPETDARRGKGVYDKLMHVMENFKVQGILYGVSITVTTENVGMVTSDTFLDGLINRGCMVIFFVEYVPVSAHSEHLAPTEKERAILEKRQIHLRTHYPDRIFLSFPGDEKHTGECLAAGRGFFHISADGNAEPCPFSPYSDTNLKKNTLLGALRSPLFQKLNKGGMLLGEHDGGCLLFQKQSIVKEMLTK